MRIGPEDLKPFQTRAAAELSAMVLEYGSGRFKHRYDSDTGVVLPFVCRLKAITGAGKTPILAVTASRLKTGIVLWTTPRGAVVSQTYDNLKPGGKYADLLPEGTSILMLPEMSEADWMSVLNATHGLSILLATVASFNQDGNMLRVHRKGSGGTPSRWEMLGNYNEGVMSRHRSLYVFYDEGHGATQEQFQRLAQLNPRAFVIASASPFPPDLAYLLPGKVYEEKAKSLEERTVTVPTKQVVEIGLLKQRLYFTVCHTSQDSALKEAETKYLELKVKLERLGLAPIACFIVNSTERAIDIWEGLLKLGVSKEKIAVHVNGAKEEVYRRYGTYLGVRDTYSGKKHSDRSPEALRRGGYTHIIWNLTLREGWDEPLAYVAYIDGKGRSETDITQKIGRFLRQPNAEPFDDPDLNAAYFYFNVQDAEFAALIKRTQEELELEGHEILRIDDQYRWPSSREVAPRMTVKVPKIKPRLGDPAKNDQIVLKLVPMLEASDRQAPGRIERVVLDLKRGARMRVLGSFELPSLTIVLPHGISSRHSFSELIIEL
ncbi:MAG: DEAD/DEAH box helicase family protein [Thermicanus sp.]|nr:DEAD/DEAH box helicase family protein [Thermicanus sp.]